MDFLLLSSIMELENPIPEKVILQSFHEKISLTLQKKYRKLNYAFLDAYIAVE